MAFIHLSYILAIILDNAGWGAASSGSVCYNQHKNCLYHRGILNPMSVALQFLNCTFTNVLPI